MDSRTLGRRRHLHQTNIRLPLGDEGCLVVRAVVLSDCELREFRIEKPWTLDAAREEGPQADDPGIYAEDTPPLDDA